MDQQLEVVSKEASHIHPQDIWSLQRAAFCAVICQRVSLQVATAYMRLPVQKAFSPFPEQAEGHVSPPVVPKSLQLQDVWKRATYPPFHREPWSVPQHSNGVQGLALEV